MKLIVKKASQKSESKWKQTNLYVYPVGSMYAQGKLFYMTLHLLIWPYIPSGINLKDKKNCKRILDQFEWP